MILKLETMDKLMSVIIRKLLLVMNNMSDAYLLGSRFCTFAGDEWESWFL